MFPKHSAGLRETEIPVLERARRLLEPPLLPVGAGVTDDDRYEWRCRAMELIDGEDGVRDLSRGRHTRAYVPCGSLRLILPSAQKSVDAGANGLRGTLSDRWMNGGDKYDLPAQFDLDLVRFLAQLQSDACAE
jgi:hypothetical protein